MNNRGTNLDTVRRYNLSRILGLVHREGAVSRSTLTRETGLNRSTVAALVSELAALRLVVEADPDVNRGVGRPSPVVRPHPDCDLPRAPAYRSSSRSRSRRPSRIPARNPAHSLVSERFEFSMPSS